MARTTRSGDHMHVFGLRNLPGQIEQLLVLDDLLMNGLPLLIGEKPTLGIRRFWLIIANVDRKTVSSETIIVSRPERIALDAESDQRLNQTMCT